MPYSLKQAADATGRTKPTILRAIQTGKISAKKSKMGAWEIEPAELHRVYPPIAAGVTRTDSRMLRQRRSCCCFVKNFRTSGAADGHAGGTGAGTAAAHRTDH